MNSNKKSIYFLKTKVSFKITEKIQGSQIQLAFIQRYELYFEKSPIFREEYYQVGKPFLTD